MEKIAQMAITFIDSSYLALTQSPRSGYFALCITHLNEKLHESQGIRGSRSLGVDPVDAQQIFFGKKTRQKIIVGSVLQL